MELVKMCPRTFAFLMYNMYKETSRLECVTRHLNWSLLIPLFKEKCLLNDPKGHRPLRLTIVFRKIHEMELNDMLESEKQRALEQFRFKNLTTAFGAAARMLSRVRMPRLISLFLDLTRVHDYVIGLMIMEIAKERCSRQIAAMVAQLPQK